MLGPFAWAFISYSLLHTSDVSASIIAIATQEKASVKREKRNRKREKK